MQGDLIIAEVCKEYGWTFDEYMSQPLDFLKVVHEKLAIERKKQEADRNKGPRKT